MSFVLDVLASYSVAMQVIDCASLASRVALLVPEEVETGVFEDEVGGTPMGTTSPFVAELV